MMGRPLVVLAVTLMLSIGSISGCFSGDGDEFDGSDLSIGNDLVASGFFHTLELQASSRLSLYVPYLILDPETRYVQNSTVIDIERGQELSLDILIPPRTDGIHILLAEYGRSHWPVRDQSESWASWYERTGGRNLGDSGAIRVPANGSLYDSVETKSVVRPGDVVVKYIPAERSLPFHPRMEEPIHPAWYMVGSYMTDFSNYQIRLTP